MTAFNYEFLNVGTKDNLQIVTLNRPKALNALNVQLLAELGRVLDELESACVLRA